MLREHKEYRSKTRIYADILTSILKQGGKSRPTRLLYGANLSYKRLKRHLRQLIELGLVEKEKEKENDMILYKLTNKGRTYTPTSHSKHDKLKKRLSSMPTMKKRGVLRETSPLEH